MARREAAFSLVEVLAVLAILGVLVALMLPAVQGARERSRELTCSSRLRQIGLAVAHHETAHGFYPSGGWGFQWVGDPDRGTGRAQPGGWLFTLLPYLEAGHLHDAARGVGPMRKAEALGAMLQAPVPGLSCPSRRKPGLGTFWGQFPLHNAVKPAAAFKSDFAGCGGSERLFVGTGPGDDSPATLARYAWPRPAPHIGVFYAGSQVRAADVLDGLAYTYFAGEKHIRMRETTGPDDRDPGDDQAAFVGDDHDVRRWTERTPRRDEREQTNADCFGSRHPASWGALLGDGSVHRLSYTVDADVHRALGSRGDGSPGALP